MKLKYIYLPCVLALFSLSSSQSWSADALQILPTRIVFTNQASAELTLVNRGTDPGTYRILLRNIRTDDTGVFQVAEKAEENELFADKFMRFSPRRVSVEPGNFQKVRIMARKPKNLAVGEYRTHMVFQTLPQQTSNELDEQAADDVDVSVKPIIEVSIPIIFRHGKLEASVSFSDIKTEEDNFKFSLLRGGNRSIYGDVEVILNAGANKETRVGYVRGISVYYPNKLRIVDIPLTLPAGSNLASEKLLVRYSEDSTYGGNETASATYP